MKTKRSAQGKVQYELVLGDESIFMHECLESELKLSFTGRIFCVACGKQAKKSFGQGYCYPCFISLAQADMCIMKPETCHFANGTCREPEWGQKHCFIPHTVYLANSSGIKVGITRAHQQQTRWMDQGAIQALPFMQVQTRKEAGDLEVQLKQWVADKTSWQKMLKGMVESVDLKQKAQELFARLNSSSGHSLLTSEPLDFVYPVIQFPSKIKSFNFDKSPEVEGTLLGIKAQYLIFDTGVINIRKFSGYEVLLEGV